MADHLTDSRLADLLLRDELGVLQGMSLAVLEMAFNLCQTLQLIQNLGKLDDGIFPFKSAQASVCRFAVGLHDQGQTTLLADFNGIVGCRLCDQAGICILGIAIFTQPFRTVFSAALLIGYNVQTDISV